MMRWRTFMTGWTLAFVILMIARPKHSSGNPDVGTAVVELTYAATPRSAARWNAAPAHAQKVVAPLVVMDVTPKLRSDAHYLISLEDIANWEESHGQMPANSVVMARSEAPADWSAQPASARGDSNAGHFPGFSEEAIRFLVEARAVYGLGTETPTSGRSVVLVYRGK